MIVLLLALIYLAFIGLGLPDAVLGSAWPLVSEALLVPISGMGLITIIISAGTIVSSLNSAKLVYKLGVYKVTVGSILLTALSLLGFATSPSFFVLCFWAVPYGLGAGSVDAALNNYVALHFESKHMSWLHCMWGIGATLGPLIMGMALTNQFSFRGGYIILFIIQLVLSGLLLAGAPVWKQKKNILENEEGKKENTTVLRLPQIVGIPGVKEMSLAFFCFCAIEQSTGLWAGSYLVFQRGVEPEAAAGFSALFYFGITVGRGICGFIAMKYSDKQMIRAGILVMAVGVAVLYLPFGEFAAFGALALIGFGSSPVFPCIIHSTPYHFGVIHSQAVTGVQMAAAYTGTLLMPAVFGVLGNNISFSLYPVFIGALLVLLALFYEKGLRKIEVQKLKTKQ